MLLMIKDISRRHKWINRSPFTEENAKFTVNLQ